MGSFDRLREPSDPNPPERRGKPTGEGSSDRPEGPGSADRPRSRPETEAEVARRLGLSTLNRSDCYDSQRAAADAQEAAIRRRDAKARKKDDPIQAPPDKPPTPIDQPERRLEEPRDYWTEVPRFFAMWQRLADRWPWRQRPEVANEASGDRGNEATAERRAGAVDAIAEIPRAEPPISDTVKKVESENNSGGWLEGFGFRLKGAGRLMEKTIEALEAQPDITPEEIVSHIPDAIRYTFCFEQRSYVGGYWDIKDRLESSGYEMYQSKNSWSDAEYKGINTRWVTPEGQRFEVQFHTRESFHAKHEVTHQAYERLRCIQTSRAERLDLKAFQRDVSSWIPVPGRVMEIPDYRREGF